MRPKIIVTGGAGYVGSFTARTLVAAGYNVVVDTLERSSVSSSAELGGARLIQLSISDPATLVAAHENARSALGWKPVFEMDSIARTAFAWHNRST